MAFYSISPFGDDREDLRTGIVSSTIANVNRGKGKSFTPQDFIPQFNKETPKKQSVETQLAIVEQMNAMFGGKDLRKN